MNRAVFLDRDGTINFDKDYVFKIEDWEFIPGAIEGLKLLYEKGFKLIVLTNQSGIARGYYKEEDMNKLHNYFLSSLKEYGVEIDKIYFCPHHPKYGKGEYKKNCNCRKPETGMIEKAVKEFNIDLSESYCIGDKTCDVKIGKDVGCRTILVLTGKGGRDGEYDVDAELVVKDLYEAAEKIVGKIKG